MLLTIVSTVLGGLILAGLFAVVKSHWLYVLIPKPYLNTPLSPGQVISLSVTNLGFLDEEDIAIRFGNGGHYEMIASSRSTVLFADRTIRLPRLPRFDTVTVHVLVEGKAFELSDIEAVEAKACTGKVVDKKEKAVSLWSYLVAIPVLTVVLVMPFFLGTMIGRDSGMSALDYLNQYLDEYRPSKQLAGYKVTQRELYAGLSGQLSRASENGKVDLHIDEIVRRADVLTINLTISNNFSNTLVVSVDATSSAPDAGPLNFWDSRITDAFIGSGNKRSRHLKAYLPDSSQPKVVLLTYRLQLGNDSSTIEQTITF